MKYIITEEITKLSNIIIDNEVLNLITLIDDLKQLIRKHPEYLKLVIERVYGGYDEGSEYIIKGERLETDQEYNKRLKKEEENNIKALKYKQKKEFQKNIEKLKREKFIEKEKIKQELKLPKEIDLSVLKNYLNSNPNI